MTLFTFLPDKLGRNKIQHLLIEQPEINQENIKNDKHDCFFFAVASGLLKKREEDINDISLYRMVNKLKRPGRCSTKATNIRNKRNRWQKRQDQYRRTQTSPSLLSSSSSPSSPEPSQLPPSQSTTLTSSRMLQAVSSKAMRIGDIGYFERRNKAKLNLAISVFLLDWSGEVFNVYKTSNTDPAAFQIDLLLLQLESNDGSLDPTDMLMDDMDIEEGIIENEDMDGDVVFLDKSFIEPDDVSVYSKNSDSDNDSDDGKSDEKKNEMIADESNENNECNELYHYVAIQNLEKLLSIDKMVTEKDKQGLPIEKRIRHKPHICRFCMSVFTTEEALTNHLRLCTELTGRNPQKYAIPLAGEQMTFTNYEKRIPHRLVGAFDFETRLLTPDDLKNDKFKLDLNLIKLFPETRDDNMVILHHQLPISYSIAIYDQLDGKLIYEKTESSDNNIMNQFFESLDEANELVTEVLDKNKECNKSADEQQRLRETAEKCYLCEEPFFTLPSKRKPLLAPDDRFPTRPSLETRTQLPPPKPCDIARQPVIDHDHYSGIVTHIIYFIV